MELKKIEPGETIGGVTNNSSTAVYVNAFRAIPPAIGVVGTSAWGPVNPHIVWMNPKPLRLRWYERARVWVGRKLEGFGDWLATPGVTIAEYGSDLAYFAQRRLLVGDHE